MNTVPRTFEEIFTFFKSGALPTILLKDLSIALYNDAALSLFKWTRADIQVSLRPLVESEKAYTDLMSSIEEGTRSRGFVKYPGKFFDSEGESFFCHVIGTRLEEDPSIILVLFIKLDKEDEESQRYRQVLNSLPVGIIIHWDEKILFANLTATQFIFGSDLTSKNKCRERLESLEGRSIWDFVPEEFQAICLSRIQRVIKNGISAPPIEIKFLSNDKKMLDFESTVMLIDYLGQTALLTVFREISEEKKLRFRLKELNDCFFSFTSDPLTNINKLVALCGRLLNGVCAFYNGICKGQLISWGQWNPPENWVSVRSPEGTICSTVLATESDDVIYYDNLQESPFVKTDSLIEKYKVQTYFAKLVKIDNTAAGVLCVLFTESRTFDESEKDLLKAISAALAIEEKRRLAENELKVSEERYRTLIELSPYVVVIIDLNEKIVYINEATLDTFVAKTPDDILNHGIREFVLDADLDKIKSEIKRQSQTNVKLKYPSLTLRTISGEEFFSEGYISSINFQGERAFQVILIDLTERLQHEEQQRQTNKAETISILAGSIAHDLKNLLSPILTATSMLLEQKRPGDILSLEDFGLFKNSEAAVIRATDLAKRLLQTARKQPMIFEPVDFNALIQDTIQTYKTSFGSNISVSFSMGSDLPPFLYLDARQIEQVLLNLAFNSRDAMPDGGLLVFTTTEVDIESGSEKNKYSKPGKFVKLTVSDTGCGMSPTLIKKIFDPFFTTKGQQGSGLGLSTTLGIIKNHGGWINVKSQENEGTTFEIFLPLTVPNLPDDLKVIKKDLTGTETILLVDDSEDVIEMGSRVLSSLGYTVLAVSDGVDALELVRDRKIDLIVADLIMPIKGGKELLEDLKEEGFHMPVLLISGYDIAKKYRQHPGGFAAFLEKPFQVNKLAEMIRNVLDCCSLEKR
jgi:PAS domain S-box-containing protein